LLSASRHTLQNYELSRLGHASNLRKEIGDLLDQWLQENTSATLARWLIDQRVQSQVTDSSAAETSGMPGETASDDFLAETRVPPRSNGGG
jgi:hypothetical protein